MGTATGTGRNPSSHDHGPGTDRPRPRRFNAGPTPPGDPTPPAKTHHVGSTESGDRPVTEQPDHDHEQARLEDLPLAVREAADTALGSPVDMADPGVASGFLNGYFGHVNGYACHVLLRDGREAFLKAAGPQSTYPVPALARRRRCLR